MSEPVGAGDGGGHSLEQRTAVGIGVTGIAGPRRRHADKPVGTVAIAVPRRAPMRASAQFQFVGAREMVKFQSAQAALNMLRLMLKQSRGHGAV